MLLATDLDGTFLGGEMKHKSRLYEIVKDNPAIRLVFVTGRGLHSIIPLFEEEPAVPRPEFIICDVGATIVNGHTLEPIEPLQSSIEARWSGSRKVLDALASVQGLMLQDVPQQRRCSYYFDEYMDINELKHKVAGLDCDLVLSAGKFADVLPKGINKGYTLKSLARHYSFPVDDILVAGDTFNDLSLFNTGYKGVVVGNAEPGLMEATAGRAYIYQAKAEGTAGILEAMEHFSFFKTEFLV